MSGPEDGREPVFCSNTFSKKHSQSGKPSDEKLKNGACFKARHQQLYIVVYSALQLYLPYIDLRIIFLGRMYTNQLINTSGN